MKTHKLSENQKNALAVVENQMPCSEWVPVSTRQKNILISLMDLGLLGHVSFNDAFTHIKKIDLSGFTNGKKKDKPLKRELHGRN